MSAAHLAGAGLVTPIGLSGPATCAALRAGISGLSEIASYTVPGALFDRVPLVGGRVPTEWFSGGPREEEWPGHDFFEADEPAPWEAHVPAGPERLVELAVPAATEALGWAAGDGGRLGLYLGLGEGEDGAAVGHGVAEGAGLHPTVSEAFPEGRASGFLALERAGADLAAGRVDLALVGGVDSLVRTPVLERLEEEGRLRSDAVPEGVIPGEAAAFVVLGLQPTQAHGLGVYGVVRGDEETARTGEPNQAAALTSVLESAAGAWGFHEPTLVVSDLNGDRYRAMEWAMASMRTLTPLQGNVPLWHPADCLGDVGAASATLSIAWGFAAIAAGYAPARRALIWGASDGPLRAASFVGPLQ